MSKQVLVVIPVEERHKEYLENKGTGCVNWRMHRSSSVMSVPNSLRRRRNWSGSS